MTVPGDHSWHPALARGAVLRHDPLREVEMLVMPERVVTLNETGAAILGLCDGARSVDGVAAECAKQFPDGFAAVDVLEFLEAFRERGWVR